MDPATVAPGSLIPPTLNPGLEAALRDRIARRRSSGGSFGELEPLAVRLGLIANSLKPRVDRPRLVFFASDHGLAAGGASVAGEPTANSVDALVSGTRPVAAFARAFGIELLVVDCGLSSTTAPAQGLLVRKVASGTQDVRQGPAMRLEQAHAALQAGMEMGDRFEGFGAACAGIGRGGEISAALLLAALSQRDLAQFIDPPRSPLAADEGEIEALAAACARVRDTRDPVELLAALGGFETATMVGHMLALAGRRRLIVVDGAAACAALLVAAQIAPAVTDYCVFARSRGGAALDGAFEVFHAAALLELGLEAIDGTGAALAWPLIRSAGLLLSDAGS